MEDKQVSVEELKQVMAADFDRLAKAVAEAMNAAQDGHIIADTEELVRDANAVFREQMYAEGDPPPAEQAGGFFPLGPKGSGTKGRSRPPI